MTAQLKVVDASTMLAGAVQHLTDAGQALGRALAAIEEFIPITYYTPQHKELMEITDRLVTLRNKVRQLSFLAGQEAADSKIKSQG